MCQALVNLATEDEGDTRSAIARFYEESRRRERGDAT